MKTLLLISTLILAISVQDTKSQNGVPDTLAYMQTIIDNKAQYIGQPFSSLYKNLQIQIKFFQPFAAIHYDKDKETSTSFSFYFPGNADELYLTFPKLDIFWQTPLNINQSNIIRAANNNRGQWNSSAEAFYANGIIKDIQIRD